MTCSNKDFNEKLNKLFKEKREIIKKITKIKEERKIKNNPNSPLEWL